ncbi:hypothetical protein C8N36_1222 [Pelagimonas varians]|uniref:Uncharacterized protein n=1 Tax=Pelagimonas varians TaxID=696760 RepID=A0A238L6B9_9RHOB|nr:hypothetical protein C8N36_1222 [Pelagimonas varians]SMX50547.1 hypothetical protein PEV8663_04698 [Pelagimonas varians]
MIEPNLPGLSVGKQCALLSISRSPFYFEPKGESEAWTCPAFVALLVLVHAALLSKATGLFQPGAEWRRRGL